jgi:hypothetical protein
VSIQAWELNGAHVGMTIPVKVFDYSKGTYDKEKRVWYGVTNEFVDAEILMVTHKKNGDVRVRVSTGGDKMFKSNAELVLS